MKNICFSLLVFFLFTANNSNAQMYEEGNVIIDAYIGGPNLYKAIIDEAYRANNNNNNSMTSSNIPTLGVRVGYLFTDKVSLGVEINYDQMNFNWTDFNSSGSFINNYEYDVTVNRLRALLRFEFHLSDSDEFDLYVPLAGGYNSTKFILETNDPNETLTQEGRSPFPVSFKAGIGARYFITNNIGINAELGFGGGPLLEGGLTLKF